MKEKLKFTHREICELNLDEIKDLFLNQNKTMKQVARQFKIPKGYLSGFLTRNRILKHKKVNDNEEAKGGDGVVRYRCPHCGREIKYRNGRKKRPLVEEITNWINKLRCPQCGKKQRGILLD